ncbi:MAG: chromosome segregation protein SMC [Oscillospiraceae bacterium]
MILKALEMQGFKSFPDKTVLEFNKGITSVVGPNGSGKSNISDAVRWVLGEQSTKNLRGSKMEDVVFSGTDLRKAKGFAEVTLRLDNKDRTMDFNNDEVSVTRRYYRSGESEYLINGESARLRDINELFMDTGLGRDGYSLVGQGKISEMISSKTGERREMLEEAAGISHFRYRKTDALKRLSQADENLIRLRDILSELEGRVGPLKTQSEKAQKFIVLAEEKKTLEIGLWLNTINKTNDKLREQDHKIEIAEQGHKAAQDDLEKIERKIDEASNSTRDINIKIEEIRNSSSHFEQQAAELEAQIKVYENSILHNNEAIERIEKDKQGQNESTQEIDEQIETALKNIEIAKIGLLEKENALNELKQKEESVKTDNLTFSERASALSAEVSNLSVSLSNNRVIAETANSSISEIASRIEAIDLSLGSRREAFEKLASEKKTASDALSQCLKEIESINNSLSGYSLRFENRSKKAESIKIALEEKNREAAKKQDRIRILEDLEKNMEGYGGAVKVVMREAKRGSLRGIHGALSQLITVKDKYSVAIETALGAAIQNIVTDTENDAKRAINYLKENKVGRATFLPIAAIRGRMLTENGLDDQFGFISIASDLVTVDKQYEEIIKAQLGRTIVAEDMDSAIAIAKKYSYRFRIVTLDGQIINAGGSMTGGSRTQNVGILSRGNEIEKLKENLKSVETELIEMNADYKMFSEDLAAARADLDGAQGDLLRANEEKIRKESDLKLAVGQIETMDGSALELMNEKETLQGRIDLIVENAKLANEQVNIITTDLAEKEKELQKITGDKEGLIKSREELSEKASEISLLILTFQKDIEANEDTVERLNGRKTTSGDRMAELGDEIKAINAKNEILKNDINNISITVSNLRNNNTDAREKIEELIKNRDEFEKQSNELRLLERAKSAERENLSGELVRLEERKIAMRKEYDDLTSKLYDEYQLTSREAMALSIEIEDYSLAGKRLSELKNSIRSLGSVNVSAIEEYKEVSERYEFLTEQISDIDKSKNELIKLIDELTEKMSAQFRERFNQINMCFGETFRELFGGGKAELKLEDERNILECDIEIKVQPPGKNVQNINLLSGGEKGLSAIALLFAILKVTPAPFCIFDEVEAALDDVNVSRYAQYVRRMTKNIQFILITHRRGTMEEADRLYGVTMQEEGVSKLLELKTAEMAKKLGLV